MRQISSRGETAITNKLKVIKNNIDKWHTRPNTYRRAEIITTRTRIGLTHLTCTFI